MADQQNFAETENFYANSLPNVTNKDMESLSSVQNGFDQNSMEPDDSNTAELTVIADGNVLKDLQGNVVGTLNEDGTYSLLDTFAVAQMGNDSAQPAPQEAETVASTPMQTQPSQVKEKLDTSSMMQEKAAIHTPIARPGPSTFGQRKPTPMKKDNASLPKPIANKPKTPQNVDKAAPLGSSKNPIRIIQQGNTFTSTQQLTEEQLQQIMQVVQQQHAMKETQEGNKAGSKAKTKIVYKVVNPPSGGTRITFTEEKIEDGSPTSSNKTGATPSQPTPRKFTATPYTTPYHRPGFKRPLHRNSPDEEELDDDSETELTKKRAKTRSG